MHAALEDLVATLGEEHRQQVKEWGDKWLMEAECRQAISDLDIEYARDPEGLRNCVTKDVDTSLFRFLADDNHRVIRRISRHSDEMRATMYYSSMAVVRAKPKDPE